MQQYYEIPELKNRDIRRLARKALKGKWLKAAIPMLIITAALVIPPLVQYQELIFSDYMNAESLQDMEKVLKEISEKNTGLFYTFLSFFSFMCTGAFTLASAALSVRILRNEEWSVKTAFLGFRQFFQSFLVNIWTNILSFLWLMVTILPGMMIYMLFMRSPVLSLVGLIVFAAVFVIYISRILRYSLSYFIAQDNAGLSAFQAVSYSVTLMTGRVGKYFSLQLSFIGWMILSSVPMGFGMAFLNQASESGSSVLKLIAVCLMILGMVTLAMMQLYVNTADAVFYSMLSGNFGIAENSAGTGSGAPETVESPAKLSGPDGGTGESEESVNTFETGVDSLEDRLRGLDEKDEEGADFDVSDEAEIPDDPGPVSQNRSEAEINPDPDFRAGSHGSGTDRPDSQI